MITYRPLVIVYVVGQVCRAAIHFVIVFESPAKGRAQKHLYALCTTQHLHVCMYECMYVYVCRELYKYIYAALPEIASVMGPPQPDLLSKHSSRCMYGRRTSESLSAPTSICMYVCIYVCMYVCM